MYTAKGWRYECADSPSAAVLMAWLVIYHLVGFARARLRRPSPGPPRSVEVHGRNASGGVGFIGSKRACGSFS
jgi:hypothetical protein